MKAATDLDTKAIQVSNYLIQENAVRVSEDEIANFKTVLDLCDALGICTVEWSRIKTHMLSKGYSICYIPGRGHYLGFPGEEVSNIVYQYKIARGWSLRIGKLTEAIRSSSPSARKWIDRRFKNFTLDEEIRDYAERSE